MNLYDIVTPMTVDEAKATKQRLDPKCWTGYKKQGTKVKGGVRVNNCVPKESVEEDSWHAGDNAWSSENHEMVEGHTFSNGDQVELKPEYADRAGEIYTVSQCDTERGRCWIGDADGRGWYARFDQLIPSVEPEPVDEGFGDNPVAGAIVNRIMRQRVDLLKQYGPELVGAAVDNVADYVGDVDEIGSSDVSAWVAQVERMLKENPPEAFAEDQADQVKKVFKDKAGQPVGEIGIDPESSPGNGEWYVHHYATGYSVVGFDSAAEAKRELLYVNKYPDAVEGHPSTKEQGMAEGWSDAVVAQRTGRPRTPYSVYIKGQKWKDFENDDHAEAVANKLRAKFQADGRDPSVITIAATDYDKGVAEEWSKKYKSSINCANPKGFSQKAHCAGKKKNESVAENTSYWHKLQNERSTKLNTLINELKESIEK